MHNFLQDLVATFMGLPTSTTIAFQVLVGSGDHLYCNTTSLQVPVTLGSHTFHIDFFILLLGGGVEVVLGVNG